MTVCAMLITACTSSEEFESTSSSMESTRNAIRTKAEAIDIAIELMNGRFGSRGAYVVENVEIIGGESSRASEDTLIYAVNLADDRGFVLVSAAKAGDAILGYADNGSVVVDDIEPNSGFSFYMDAARNYVRSMQLDTIKVDPIPNPFIPVTIYEKVEPLAPQRWGQNYPEGMYCPNRLSGCGQLR